MKFAAGDKVRDTLIVAGIPSARVETVLRVDDQGVWLDNGSGNDPSGPFDSMTGELIGGEIPGLSIRRYIRPL